MGFSADWLALRENADRAARDDGLLRQAAHAAGPHPVVLDLGCGTGATHRALSPHLSADASWRLLDSDAGLLEIAKASVGPMAETYHQDLKNVADLPLTGVTLVTASALLDLVSDAWLTSFADRLCVPFYAALSYDGVMHWTPEQPQDAEITSAFNAHQRTDKGFGAALGPDAATRAVSIFEQAGFEVYHATSPWHLTAEMTDLQVELVDGIAKAAQETGAAGTVDWSTSKRATAHETCCVIGHVDILAVPRKSPEETS